MSGEGRDRFGHASGRLLRATFYGREDGGFRWDETDGDRETHGEAG